MCSACAVVCRKDAKHEKTPLKMSLRDRRASADVERSRARTDIIEGVFSCSACIGGCGKKPNTKRHHRRCLFVFSVHWWMKERRRAQTDTIEGVSSCSACVAGCRNDAEHEQTPLKVSLCVRRVSGGWERCRARKHTMLDVCSCSACVSVNRKHGNTPIIGGFRAIPVVEQVLLVPMQVLVKKHVPFWEMGTTAHHPPLNCIHPFPSWCNRPSRWRRWCGVENVDMSP